MAVPKYKRVLLKLGGESLAGQGGFGISPSMAEEVAAKVKAVKNHDVEVAIVLGEATCGAARMVCRMAWSVPPPTTWV